MVDNKPGAGGNLATREMLRTPAEAAGHIARETGIGKKVIADANIRLE
jgi:tripartite-type tricarboxylate transporter receptor subunit TctC